MTPTRCQLCIFLSPWAIGLLVLTIIPMICSLLLSFSSWEGIASADQAKWVATQNYQTLLAHHSYDSRFYAALTNTVTFSIIAVPLGLIASLAVAILLSVSLPGVRVFRSLVYLPHLLGGVATVLIWSWLLNPQFGWINEGIRFVYLTLDPLVRLFRSAGTTDWTVPAWLYSPTWCKPAIILIHVWTFGASVLIFIAALRRVPRSLLDAAILDGAGAWSRFRAVTWPHITPVLLFTYVVGMIFAMQTFNESYLLQNPSQSDGLLFLATYLYESAFSAPYRLGYAAAVGWIMCIATALLVVPAMLFSRKWVFESGHQR